MRSRTHWRLRPAGAIIVAGLMCLTAALADVDSYEPDNSPLVASPITGDGTPQTHTIDPEGDRDWVKFDAQAGDRAEIETTPTASDPVRDTVIYLYDTDGETLLREDDDGGEALYSRLTYVLPAAGTYYVKVTSYQGNYAGGYRISVKLWSGGGPADGIVTRRAVCVGISDYAGSVNDLNYCDDDAREFADALAAGENWDAGNIVVIVDRQATAANIWDALNTMAAQSDADDQCVFFFSGHGTRDNDVPPLDEAGGLDEYLVETDMNSNIRDDELGEWAAGLATDNLLVVLCSCFSGGFIKGAAGAKGLGPPEPGSVAANDFAADIYRALARRRRVRPLDVDDAGRGVVLTAADDDETCQESSELAHDVFNFYLLQGMAGPADDNSDGWVTAEEMYAYAGPRATEYNSGQHAQIYDAAPATPLQVVNPSAPAHTVTITNGPWGDPNPVEPGGQMDCLVLAQDSLGGALDYQWSVTDAAGAPAGVLDDPSAAAPTWTAPPNNSGHTREYTATVIVSSASDPGVSDEGSFTVQVMTTLQRDFPAGVSMISIPGIIDAAGRSMEQLTGAAACVLWDADVQAYLPAGPPTVVPAQGRGCWAQFARARSVQLIGLTRVEDTFIESVQAGWNIVALPWNENVSIAGMTSLPEEKIPQAAWSYYDGQYHLVAAIAGLAGVGTELEPWRSYWINATENCNLRFDRTAAPAATGAAMQPAPQWSIR
ncbi:MAG: DVUA0089 family protein, partial [Armatimonadetes bacterium]|nr:DVUA0089 family protein [Armatimonadota bacterium]